MRLMESNQKGVNLKNKLELPQMKLSIGKDVTFKLSREEYLDLKDELKYVSNHCFDIPTIEKVVAVMEA